MATVLPTRGKLGWSPDTVYANPIRSSSLRTGSIQTYYRLKSFDSIRNVVDTSSGQTAQYNGEHVKLLAEDEAAQFWESGECCEILFELDSPDPSDQPKYLTAADFAHLTDAEFAVLMKYRDDYFGLDEIERKKISSAISTAIECSSDINKLPKIRGTGRGNNAITVLSVENIPSTKRHSEYTPAKAGLPMIRGTGHGNNAITVLSDENIPSAKRYRAGP